MDVAKREDNFFEKKACNYYPCHDLKEINCKLCFCPLYDKDCKGDFTILKNGLKDCSNCTIPHERDFKYEDD